MLNRFLKRPLEPVTIHFLETPQGVLFSLESIGQYTRPGVFFLDRTNDSFYHEAILFALHRKIPSGLQRLGFLWKSSPQQRICLEVWCYGSPLPLIISFSGGCSIPQEIFFAGSKESREVKFDEIPKILFLSLRQEGEADFTFPVKWVCDQQLK